MIRKFSLFLTVVMLINILIFTKTVSVLAVDTESFSNYTLLDVCYSEEQGLFIAVGNHITTNAGTVFASADGKIWAKTKTFSQRLGYSEYDCVIWWPAEQVFVVYFPTGLISTSENGYDWSGGKTIEGLTVNGGITVDEDGYMLHFYGYYISIYKSLTDVTTYKYTTYEAPASVTNVISGGTGDAKTIYGVAQYRGAGTWDNGQSWNQIAAYVGTSTVKDWVYSKVQNCFYIATASGGSGKIVGKIDRRGNISAVDPSNINARLNAVNISNKHMVAGTATGEFYKTPDAVTTLGEMVWTKITSSDSSYVPSLPQRFASGNNKLVTISNKNSNLQNSKGQILLFNEDLTDFTPILSFNTSPYSIKLESGQRFEVPAEGQPELTVEIEAELVDLKGNALTTDSIKTITAGALPNGITYDNGVFTIQPGASSGRTTLTFTSENNFTEVLNITFVKEAYIEIESHLDIAIPELGFPPDDWEFIAVVYGDDDMLMDRTATISIITELPYGAEFIAGSNAIRLQNDAETGTYIIRAVSDTNPDIYVERDGTIDIRRPRIITITTGYSSIEIPDSNALTVTYAAVIKDQTDTPMTKELIDWMVVDSQTGSSFDNVYISSSGELTVMSSAYKGSVDISAALVSDTIDLSDTCTATLTYTDLRCAIEDSIALTIFGDLENVTDNLVLETLGENDTIITWTSTNTNYISISSLGTVTRPSRKDEAVTLTATVKKNSDSKSKVFVLNVLKADNLFTNGDFEESDFDGWQPVDSSQPALDTTVKNSGLQSLSVDGGGVSQELTFTNNSSYYVEGYVLGSVADQLINIASDKASNVKSISKKVQNKDFTKITALFTYTKQNSEFTEAVKIYSTGTGGFYIDDFKAEEITLEYDELMAAIVKAEYSKKSADIEAAKTFLTAFPYDIPEKEGLNKRISNISASTTTTPTSGGGGGSGKTITTPTAIQAIPDNSEMVSDHLLTFKDLKEHWAKDDVEYMAAKGFVQGKDEYAFDPDAEITRAEFAVLAVRILGGGGKPYQNSFYDIVTEDWYSSSIQEAKDLGLISGSDGLFLPQNPITRQEMTKIVVSAYNSKTKTNLETGGALFYSDYYNVSPWAYDYVVSAVNLGFVQGVSETIFSPLTHATRAQAVIILKRFYDKINENQEDGN